jgi:TetR/AcrR family transcriptional regulator
MASTRRQKAAPLRRSQGRPKADCDNNVGREALITAARTFLATTSPSQINRLEIARAAGVDPGLIRYYFGNKDELLAEAMERIALELRERTTTALASAGDRTPRERFVIMVQSFFSMMVTHPNYHQLIVEQIIHAKNARARALRRELTRGFQERLKELVADGQASGDFGAVDTRLLEIALIGMCEFFSSAWPVLEEMFGASTSRASVIERYGTFIADFTVKGIAAGPAVSSRPPSKSARKKSKV